MATGIQLLCFAAVPLIVQASFPAVYVNERGMTPDNISLLVDDDVESCTTFDSSQGQPVFKQYAQFPIEVPDKNTELINVTLLGINLACYSNLYVSPISEIEASRWLGRWNQCILWKALTIDERESCSFQCNCSEKCDQIQVMKTSEYLCTLCHISFDNIVKGCEDGLKNVSGVYHLIFGSVGDQVNSTDVYCDMTSDGGGWTVLVRRIDGSVNFTREWQDYKIGFGSLNGEFWAGNELMHRLTTDGRQYTLRVDLEGYNDQKIFAIYTDFWVGPESDCYRLHVSGYVESSTAGDALSHHNDMLFSTASHDNDASDRNCGLEFNPWWHWACCTALLTARYGPYPEVPETYGIKWLSVWNQSTFAKHAVMMIRPNEI